VKPLKKRKFGEPFSTTEIQEGIFYYNPKTVGMMHYSNFKKNFKRKDIINHFIMDAEKKIMLRVDEETRLWVQDLIKTDLVFEREHSLSKLIKIVREPENQFDRNAVAVWVFGGIRYDNVFLDVGYLPAEHTKIINKSFGDMFLIGARKSGLGLRLDIILTKEEGMLSHGPKFYVHQEEKKVVVEKPVTFLSLRQMRQQLEVD